MQGPVSSSNPSLPQRSPGEDASSSSTTGQGLVSAPPHRLSPGISYDHNGLRHVGGVSSRPRPWSCNCSPARRLSQQYYSEVQCRGLLNMISLRTWTPHGPNTLCDWGSRAERLDRSLDAYTPIPSTPSSMGALVTVPQSCRQDWYVGLEWLPIFGRGFGLRCFQPLSSIAWLPGSALSDNR